MKHSLIPAYVVVLGSLTLASTSYAAQPEQRAPSIIQVQTVGKQAMPSVAAAPASPTPSAATIVAPRHLAQTKATPAPRSAKSSVEQVGVDIISKWTASGVPDGIWYVDRARASSAPYARRSLKFEVVKRKRSTVFRYSKQSLENIFGSPQTAGLPFIHITGESSPRFEVAFATKAHDHDHTHTRL